MVLDSMYKKLSWSEIVFLMFLLWLLMLALYHVLSQTRIWSRTEKRVKTESFFGYTKIYTILFSSLSWREWWKQNRDHIEARKVMSINVHSPLIVAFEPIGLGSRVTRTWCFFLKKINILKKFGQATGSMAVVISTDPSFPPSF